MSVPYTEMIFLTKTKIQKINKFKQTKHDTDTNKVNKQTPLMIALLTTNFN